MQPAQLAWPRRGKRRVRVRWCLGLVCLAWVASAAAQPFERAHRWDVFAVASYQVGDHTRFEDSPVTLEFDDSVMGGIGVGYEIDNHFVLGFQAAFGLPDLTARGPDQTFTSESFLVQGLFTLDYNILPTRITPFVTAGVGWTYFESNLPDPPPGWTCSPDQWRWYCDDLGRKHSETGVALQAGVGLRWDITDQIFTKLTVFPTWTHFSDTKDYLQFGTVMFSFGGSF